MLQGKLLRHNPSAGVLTQDNLVLQKVSRHQSGEYSCVVTNTEGDGESNSTYLDVKCEYSRRSFIHRCLNRTVWKILSSHDGKIHLVVAPVCNKSSLVSDYGADRGEKVRVECEVEANPPSVTFVWEFNSDKTGSSSLPTEFTNDVKRSYIEFQPNSDNDYGVLYCKARNSVGEQKRPCAFRIHPVGKYFRENARMTHLSFRELAYAIECLNFRQTRSHDRMLDYQ